MTFSNRSISTHIFHCLLPFGMRLLLLINGQINRLLVRLNLFNQLYRYITDCIEWHITNDTLTLALPFCSSFLSLSHTHTLFLSNFTSSEQKCTLFVHWKTFNQIVYHFIERIIIVELQQQQLRQCDARKATPKNDHFLWFNIIIIIIIIAQIHSISNTTPFNFNKNEWKKIQPAVYDLISRVIKLVFCLNWNFWFWMNSLREFKCINHF